jgi:hypothetical protein
MISMEDLAARRDILVTTLQSSEDMLIDIKDRAKFLKKEITNARGAIIELDLLMGRKI